MAKRSDLFIRLSLDYANHPKIASLSDAAFRAHVEMILYSRKYETDGILKNRVVNRLGSGWDAEAVAELLTNDEEAPSLIQLDNGDYELHGFADMQETRAEIAARRRKNADNGKLGGRPPKPQKTQSVTESVPQRKTQSGTQKKAETETETETEEVLNHSSIADANGPASEELALIVPEDPGPTEDQLFDAFWEEYPNKTGKKPARTKFAAALKRGADPQEIISGAHRYAMDPNREQAYTKHATTWLNGEHWTDPPLPPRGGSQRQTAADRKMQTARERHLRLTGQQDGEAPWTPRQIKEA